MNSKQQVKGKLGHVVKFRFNINMILNVSIAWLRVEA